MKVKSESEVTQSCPTLRDPMDYSLQGSSIRGIFQARVLEWGPIAFSSYGRYRGINHLGFIQSFTYYCNTWNLVAIHYMLINIENEVSV